MSDSCCCGSGNDENGCCDPEASKDEPNLGDKQEVVIDYLYLDQSVCDRCQGTDKRVELAMDKLSEVMDMAGYTMTLNRHEIADEELAEKYQFLSSPTVRVNGVDICPEVIENECDCCRSLSDYDVNCRQFEFNGKLYEVPPTAYVVQRILQIVFGHEEPSGEPYEMPENIRGFLQGKIEKEAREAQKQQDYVATAEKAGVDGDLAARIFAARPKHRLGEEPKQGCCC